jgi:hypothetical protein
MTSNEGIRSYMDGERVEESAARKLIAGLRPTFYDDLGGGSEAIYCFRLDDGRALVCCTGTGDWLLPADVDAEAMCLRAAHECYVAAGFDSPYED